WASFNNSTGQLSGTPGDGDAGTYGNIVIAVSDGTDTVAMQPFTITVEPAPQAVGSFTLSWTAPATRADGSPIALSEIERYHIYYGEASGRYPYSIVVNDGSAQSAVVDNIPAGTYRVVMTSQDTNGLESAYSVEVVKEAR
ncbi:MAG: putative Ig domain-containing protein, partial [Thiohalobacterales bacterium]|nr:putative Ig domain-containing protein [Thiohalobacterales bacterium]